MAKRRSAMAQRVYQLRSLAYELDHLDNHSNTTIAADHDTIGSNGSGKQTHRERSGEVIWRMSREELMTLPIAIKLIILIMYTGARATIRQFNQISYLLALRAK
jgi:hypothetical protein